MVDDPKIPFNDLLRFTGLSPKTVRNHLNLLLETKTISVDPLLGALADSGELIYPLVITGTITVNEIRGIMGQAALLRFTQDPPMKYLLCRGTSFADVIIRIRNLESVAGVESVEISLNREVLESKDFRHSLLRGEINKLETRR